VGRLDLERSGVVGEDGASLEAAVLFLIACAGRSGKSGQMQASAMPRAAIQALSSRALPDWDELLKPWI
jgi:hypothetical protein